MHKSDFGLAQRRQGAKGQSEMPWMALIRFEFEQAGSVLCAFALLREILLGCVVALVAGLYCEHAAAEDVKAGPSVPDASKIVGSDQCAKCHQPEVQQWIRTPHYATFDTLHRNPRAKEIAEKLGLQSIKRSGMCTQCHYTMQNQDGRDRVVAGVSCESCHGGALNWLALHADYGGAGVTRETESAEHRAKRVKDSVAQGMNNPHNIYLIARQCYDCHTIPNEKLVNVGGHLAGSQNFELVAWSQGMVRHNFVRTGGSTNATPSPEELRVMYVVGVMTDLEFSLRAVAAATDKATFGVTSAQRAARMKKRLHEIQKLVNDSLIQTALEAVATVELRLGNEEAIVSAADDVGKAAYEFADQADGRKLTALDVMLPAAKDYKN
jgi:Cytochrome c554 and c-prime